MFGAEPDINQSTDVIEPKRSPKSSLVEAEKIRQIDEEAQRRQYQEA